jgi:hypothetical protein
MGNPSCLRLVGSASLPLHEKTPDYSEGVLNLIRLLGGYTHTSSAQTAFNTDTFNEQNYLAKIQATSGNLALTLNW